MRNWLKTVFFLSAFSPIFISLAISRYISKGMNEDVFYYSVCGILGTFLTVIIINAIRKSGEVISFTAKKIKANDALLLGVVASYFFPFIAKASDLTVSTTIAIAAGVAAVLWFMSSIPPHPLLRLLSFRFYEVESANGVVYTLISQRELRDPKDVKKVKKISSSMLMEIT